MQRTLLEGYLFAACQEDEVPIERAAIAPHSEVSDDLAMACDNEGCWEWTLVLEGRDSFANNPAFETVWAFTVSTSLRGSDAGEDENSRSGHQAQEHSEHDFTSFVRTISTPSLLCRNPLK
jgi:hypothetical protein